MKRAIQSIKAQSSGDVEIIVCADEGSPETRQIASEFLSPSDVFVSHHSGGGPASSRNIAMSLASGKYIGFLDDDDSLEPYFIESLIQYLDPQSVTFCNFSEVLETRKNDRNEIVQKNLISLKDRIVENLYVKNFIPNNCLYMPRFFLNDIKFDTYLKSHEDWDFILTLKKYYNFRHADIFGPCVHRDISGNAHRNLLAVENGSTGLDYLSIYRKHTANSESIRFARQNTLKRLGLHLDPNLL